MKGREWFRKYRTMIGAAVLTVVSVAFVFAGKLEVSRAFVAMAFVWAIALHSRDINDHKEEVLIGLEHAAKAGVMFRAGRMNECEAEAAAAADTALDVAKQIHATKSIERQKVY